MVTSRPEPASCISPARSRLPGSKVRLAGLTPGGPARPREAWPVVSRPSCRAEALFSSQVVSTPSSISRVSRVATPSSSKGAEPRPRLRCGSSTMSTPLANTGSPSLVFRKDTPRATEGPATAPTTGEMIEAASRFSKITGAVVLSILRAPRRATARRPASWPMDSEVGSSVCQRVERPS